MEAREAVIVDTMRTAVGKRKGALATWHPSDLLGLTLRSLLERNDVRLHSPGSEANRVARHDDSATLGGTERLAKHEERLA